MAVRRNYFKNGTPKPDPADNGCTGAPKVHPGCGTCAHPERARIEALYVSGMSLDQLAAQFPPLKRDATFRHCKNHLSDVQKVQYLAGPAAIADLVNQAVQEDRAIIDYYKIVRSELMHAANTAAARLERVAGRLLETLRDMGKLTGELREYGATSISITNNHAVVMNSPIIAEIQAEIIDALAPFQEAREAVIARLISLDERHRQPEMKLIEAAE